MCVGRPTVSVNAVKVLNIAYFYWQWFITQIDAICPHVPPQVTNISCH